MESEKFSGSLLQLELVERVHHIQGGELVTPLQFMAQLLYGRNRIMSLVNMFV